VLDEMGNSPVNEAKEDILNGLNFYEGFALEKEGVLGDDYYEAVLEHKYAGRKNFEEEIVASDVMFGPFENHSDVVGLKLKTADLIGVKGRVKGVLVNFELLDEVLSLGLFGSDIDGHNAFAIATLRESAFTYT
jgi:hypothetical protein